MGMVTEKEKQELLILHELEAGTQALGSGILCDALRKNGEEISEATVGRILRELDFRGFTKRIGFQGRMITNAGQERLRQLLSEKQRDHYGSELIKSLRSAAKQDLIDILVARRAIESEIARLAAINASNQEIAGMKEILEKQLNQVNQGQTGAGSDVEFHRLLAQAGKNRILQAAMDLIRQDGQLSPIFEFVRKEVKSDMVADHEKILQAIIKGDADQAGQAMIDHLEGLINDVQKYWEAEN